MKDFNLNSPFLFAVAGLVILFVVVQAVFFLVKSVRRAKAIGMEMKTVKKTMVSSAVFTVAPAVSILLGVITLSKSLGLPLPWMRLSVIGSLTYELTAAETAATAVGASISAAVTNPATYTAIIWVMTLGILPGLIIIPLFMKKIQGSITKVKTKDNKWGEILISSLFLGMISAFLGVIFATVSEGLRGWIPVFVMLCSAAIMSLIGLFVKKCKVHWMEDFALPISMLGAMALAIPITGAIL